MSALASWSHGAWSAPPAAPLSPPRAVLKYPGSKARLAPILAELCPQTRTWCEVFCGSGIVTLHRSPAAVDVLNDKCGHVANFFRVLRHPQRMQRLCELLELTPHSRREYQDCWRLIKLGGAPNWPVEWARAFSVVTWQSFGARGLVTEGGWRRTVGAGNRPYSRASIWQRLPGRIRATAERLRYCEVEEQDFRELMPAYRQPWVTLYLDPPYLCDRNRLYPTEMAEQDHVELLELALAHPGPVVISSYASDLYSQALDGWERLQLRARSEKSDRTELIWRNRVAVEMAPVESLSGTVRRTLARLAA